MSSLQNVSRRGLLKGLFAGGGLVLCARVGAAPWLGPFAEEAVAEFAPNMFLSIDQDGLVKILAHRSEMGTGIRTALPLVVADELDALRDKIEIVQAIGDARLGSQNTDGSKSIRDFYQPMREAGAAARAMLEQAAANAWGVPVADCHARAHQIVHAKSGKKLGFGQLVEAAAKLEVPDAAELSFKSPDQWRYVGKDLRSVDSADLTTGAGVFGLDVTPKGCRFATIARCPVVGGKVKSVDSSAAENVSGFLALVTLGEASSPVLFNPLGGVAVIATSTYAAMKARDALKIEWDRGANKAYDSTAYRKQLEKTVQEPNEVVRTVGDFDSALATADKTHSADYYLPHLAHAPMEPPCAVAHVTEAGCEIWAPVQNPQAAQETVAIALGYGKDVGKVTCHVTLLGCGFGRKSKPDYCAEAALLSRKIGAPVKVIWTREDDLRHGFYHSVAALSFKAGLDAKGKPTAWLQRSAFPSLMSTFNPTIAGPGPFELALGFTDVPYVIPHFRAEYGKASNHLRIGWLRSVCNVFHAFAVSSFTDELAVLAKRDAVEYTLELIGEDRKMTFDGAEYSNYGKSLDAFPADTARLKAVARLCAEKAGWGGKLGKGKGRGFAVHRSFLSYAAVIAQVEVSKDGKLSMPRVDIALDCGLVVSPDRVRAQMEGSVVFGASIALYGEITAKDGAVEQGNFDTYPLVRMDEAPREIHVHLVPSQAAPAGVGEPGVPPVAPAICAAIYQAIGKRVRDLPLSKHDLSW